MIASLKQNQNTAGENFPERTKRPKGPKGRTYDQLAKELGVSGKTYGELKTINADGTEDLKQAVRDKPPHQHRHGF